MSDVEIRRVRDEGDREVVRAMVWEFMDLLRARYPEMNAEIDTYIEHQNLAAQLADFDAYFLPPNGECFLALRDGAPVGIVKLRPAADGACELNRMYVTEAGRGAGIGRRLCQAVIDEARALGYRTVLLDALSRHVEALPLYESVGFVRHFPQDGFLAEDDRVIHMRLDLEPERIAGPV